MSDIDFVSLFAPVLALSFIIERILDVGFDLVELILKTSPERKEKPDYKALKNIATFLIGVVMGIIIASGLSLNFFSQLGDSSGQLLTGVIAGSLAPYSHQILEVLRKGQKNLERGNTNNPPSPTTQGGSNESN